MIRFMCFHVIFDYMQNIQKDVGRGHTCICLSYEDNKGNWTLVSQYKNRYNYEAGITSLRTEIFSIFF